MGYLIDTDIAIHVRDKSPEITDAIAKIEADIAISAITRVELEGGVHRIPAFTPIRRQRLAIMLETLTCLDFDNEAAAAYGKIVSVTGYSRPKLIDRMIAAHALATSRTLITINGADFSNIADLKLEVWPSPPPLA